MGSRGRRALSPWQSDLGELEEAEILKTFGDVPEDFRGVT
jgi:hypothetical protein